MVFLRDQPLFEIIDFIPQISFHSYADDIQIYDYMIYVPDSNPNNDAHDFVNVLVKYQIGNEYIFLIEKR